MSFYLKIKYTIYINTIYILRIIHISLTIRDQSNQKSSKKVRKNDEDVEQETRPIQSEENTVKELPIYTDDSSSSDSSMSVT